MKHKKTNHIHIPLHIVVSVVFLAFMGLIAIVYRARHTHHGLVSQAFHRVGRTVSMANPGLPLPVRTQNELPAAKSDKPVLHPTAHASKKRSSQAKLKKVNHKANSKKNKSANPKVLQKQASVAGAPQLARQ